MGDKTVIIDHTTTLTVMPQESSTSTSMTTADLANQNSHTGSITSKNRNIIIGCTVGIGLPLLVGIGLVVYFTRNKARSFINSEGELVHRAKQDEMIDEKYFAETVADEDIHTLSRGGTLLRGANF